MKNVIVYIDPTTNTPVAKTLPHSHAAYEAMLRAGKQGIKALYCAPADIEKTKADLLALSSKTVQATAPAVPKAVAMPKETLPVHMVVSVEKPNGNKATIQYKNENKAAAAYRAAKADPANKVYAGYRTVTIRFSGSGLYTYLTDHAIKTKTVNVRTEDGMKTAYVVDKMIRTRRELLEMAQRRGYETINDFFKVLEEV